MSSQDTMNYAESEEQSAKVLQDQIEKQQAKIDALQNDSNSEAMKNDIARESQIMDSLQQKREQHIEEAQRLRQKVAQEQQQEQQEEARRQQEEEKDSLMKKAADATDLPGLF